MAEAPAGPDVDGSERPSGGPPRGFWRGLDVDWPAEVDGGGACGADVDADGDGSSVDADEEGLLQMVAGVRAVLEAIGEDPNRDGLQKTPIRVARALRFATKGYRQSASSIIGTALFSEAPAGSARQPGEGGGAGGMVVVRHVDLFSCCAACLLPLRVRCHLAYVPAANRVVGLSKLPRVANAFARRLQTPQRLADELAHAIQDAFQPAGTAVALECWHLAAQEGPSGPQGRLFPAYDSGSGPKASGRTAANGAGDRSAGSRSLRSAAESRLGWRGSGGPGPAEVAVACAARGRFLTDGGGMWEEFAAMLQLDEGTALELPPAPPPLAPGATAAPPPHKDHGSTVQDGEPAAVLTSVSDDLLCPFAAHAVSPFAFLQLAEAPGGAGPAAAPGVEEAAAAAAGWQVATDAAVAAMESVLSAMCLPVAKEALSAAARRYVHHLIGSTRGLVHSVEEALTWHEPATPAIGSGPGSEAPASGAEAREAGAGQACGGGGRQVEAAGVRREEGTAGGPAGEADAEPPSVGHFRAASRSGTGTSPAAPKRRHVGGAAAAVQGARSDRPTGRVEGRKSVPAAESLPREPADVAAGGALRGRMVVHVSVPVSSLCEHHLLPFFGRIHVGYVAGAGGRHLARRAVARLGQLYGQRLQVQERLTRQVAEGVQTALGDAAGGGGVIAVVEASHMCMVSRGIEKGASSTATISALGCFAADGTLRAAFLRRLPRPPPGRLSDELW